MSARSRFFHRIALLVLIDCISLSTSQNVTRAPSEENQQSTKVRNSTIHENTTPAANSSSTWLHDTLKDIAYYLRAHKFNEYDRRYEANAKLARREYYKSFPRPPLRSLHWEVHKYCEESLIECADYLRKRIRRAGMRREDDTAVVVREQQWNKANNSKQIEIVDEECRKMRDADDVNADPFEGPLERYQWRVSASYYLCWYTMKSHFLLEHIFERCDNFASCLDPEFGAENRDPRANDSTPYSCALYSFCPDPCCPAKHLTRPEKCWNTPDNPCIDGNPPGQRECVVDRSENTEFTDIVLNRWNVTCQCPRKGFRWSSLYGICVDIDECATGANDCDRDKEVCLNLPGGFQCACKWGHTYDTKTRECKPSDALIHLILHKQENEEETANKTMWTKFFHLFAAESSSGNEFALQTNLLIVPYVFVYFPL